MTTYLVHNTSRARHNRALRMTAPEHGGHKQYIGGEHRLVIGRPIPFTEEKLHLHLEELKEKARVGLVEVKGPDGRRVNLDTLEPLGTLPATPRLYNKRPDSIANDVQLHGWAQPQFQGGIPEIPEPGKEAVPSLVANAAKNEEEEEIKVTTGKKKGKR
jgi:hypothetical protein